MKVLCQRRQAALEAATGFNNIFQNYIPNSYLDQKYVFSKLNTYSRGPTITAVLDKAFKV